MFPEPPEVGRLHVVGMRLRPSPVDPWAELDSLSRPRQRAASRCLSDLPMPGLWVEAGIAGSGWVLCARAEGPVQES